MDEPKSSPVGVPPPNLPVVNPSVTPPKPSTSIAPAPPKPPIYTQPAQPLKPSQPAPTAPQPLPRVSTGEAVLPHTPPQPQGDITLPRSSIRTMESDIKSAQSGQVPKGVEIKPSILPAETKPITPPEPSKLVPSPAVPPIGIKLGEAEKRTTPLPGQSIVKPVPKLPEAKPIPIPIPIPPVISPAAPAPLLKPVPVTPPSAPKPPITPPSSLAVPPKQSLFANKKILIGAAVIILALVGGFLYLRSSSEPEVVINSPPPSISPTPTLGSSSKYTLSSIFGQPTPIFIIANSQNELVDLKNEAIGKSNSVSSQNLLISVQDTNSNDPSLVNLKFSHFLGRFNISFPANLSSSVDNNDFNLILTKQTEFFDQNGKFVASPSAEDLLRPKIALTVRVVDALEASQQLTVWEDTMISDLSEFYDLSSQYGDRHFSDGLYRGIKIRYINFLFPDQALDYAIVTAKNGNDYLIMANSRQQMYSIIDQLLGF